MIGERTEIEWQTWRSFCKHFEELTHKDINQPECKAMVDAIKRWGEELVFLRMDYPLPTNHLTEVRESAPIHPRYTEGVCAR